VPYYKVFPAGDSAWLIREKLGVGAFLFEGEEKALLLDTCNGFRDIRKTIGKLSQKPLTVLNSTATPITPAATVSFEKCTSTQKTCT